MAMALAATLVTSASAGPESVKVHPVESACLDYELTGQMMNGTIKRCHRAHGHESYEIQNFTMGIAGFKQTQNQHTIIIGDTIYAIDLANKTGTRTKNPMYDSLVTSMKGKSTEEMSNAFITGMGYSPTGESRTVANMKCRVYRSAQMGTVCLTDDALMLEQSFMGNTTRAVKVAVGEEGDDAGYSLYKDVEISEGPDLSDMPNLQDLMNQKQP
jgi:hypothetical protein